MADVDPWLGGPCRRCGHDRNQHRFGYSFHAPCTRCDCPDFEETPDDPA